MKNAKRGSVFLLCAAMVFLFVGCSGTGPDTKDLSGIIETSYPRTVSIEIYDRQYGGGRVSAGSGVIVHADNNTSLLATNAHVIGDKGTDENPNYNSNGVRLRYSSNVWISIIHWSGDLYAGRVNPYSYAEMAPYTVARFQASTSTVLYDNAKEDLAIIKFTPRADFRNNRASLRSDEKKPPRVGEPVAALGYSFGEFYRASVGVVTQVFPRYTTSSEGGKEFKYAFMHDAITINGNSGGPVFDAEGNLLGLTTMVIVMCVSGDSGCIYDPPAVRDHDCDVAALGFSLAISARHIAEVMDRPAHASWYA